MDVDDDERGKRRVRTGLPEKSVVRMIVVVRGGTWQPLLSSSKIQGIKGCICIHKSGQVNCMPVEAVEGG